MAATRPPLSPAYSLRRDRRVGGLVAAEARERPPYGIDVKQDRHPGIG